MLTEQLEKCNRFISINSAERPVFTSHYDRIRDAVINRMKKDSSLFKKLFHRTQLSGSYADGLKVSEPNEFDVLLILKIPGWVQKIRSGYVQILPRSDSSLDLFKITDNSGYLKHNKVLEWLRLIMKNIFSNKRNSYIIGGCQYEIEHFIQGPANTLKIRCLSTNEKFSIDFVGALEFPVKDFWMADAGAPREWFMDCCWNAIPKPQKSTPKPIQSSNIRQVQTIQSRNQTQVNRTHGTTHANRGWVCSYAEIERSLIHNLGFLKPLIRIFKKIRDTHDLTNLKSYYIKQIFIHQRMRQPVDYWRRPLGDLFLEMLNVIIEYLRSGNLPFFWHTNFNLFHQLSREQIDDLKNKFERVRKNVTTTHQHELEKVILNDREQEKFATFV